MRIYIYLLLKSITQFFTCLKMDFAFICCEFTFKWWPDTPWLGICSLKAKFTEF